MDQLALLGRMGIDKLAAFGRSGMILFQALVARPQPTVMFPLLVKQIYFVGVLSLIIIVVSGLFIGMVLGLQGYTILVDYGSEQAVGQMVALSLVRELAPVVTALLFAGRAGSALTAEIGLMKAMGMSGAKIFLLFSTEAILLGFWGSLLGILAGIGIGQVANKIASNSILKDLPGFDLLAFPVMSLLTILLIIMTVAFIAGTLPARRAAKQNPIDALRYE